jgi:hypothetical protein
MTKLKIGIIGVLVAVGVIAQWVIHRQAQSRLQEEVEALRLRTERMDSLLAENGRLSHLVAHAETANSLDQNQLSELLRLRGEVGQLRQQASEAKQLQAEIRRLQTSANAGHGKSDTANSKEEDLDIQLPKVSWAFAGYSTPEAALQTLLWARREGDFNSVLASLTPGFVEQAQKAWGDKVEQEVKAELPGDLDRVTNCRISKKAVLSDDEVKLYFALGEPPQKFGDNGLRTKTLGCGITVKRIGNEWKLEP